MGYLNLQVTDEKTVNYNSANIHVYKQSWTECDDNGKKFIKSAIICYIKNYNHSDPSKTLNLGECCNGDAFRGINHAIEQAKTHIDIVRLYNW
jgi:hypothetical protein